MKVDLVIPVYNEQAQLRATVSAIVATANHWNTFQIQLVIANNGSTDGTTEIAEELASSYPNLRHEYLPEKGRGRALKKVWDNSTCDIVSYMDVDLSTDLSFFPLLIAPIQIGNADLSIGSRLLVPKWTERGWRRELISRGYNYLLRSAFAPSFTDAQCGFKAMKRAAAQRLLPLVEDESWFFDTELLLLASHFGFRIKEIPVRWRDDPDSRVRVIPTIIEDVKGLLRMKRRLKLMNAQVITPDAFSTNAERQLLL